jgi:hypothetical protein
MHCFTLPRHLSPLVLTRQSLHAGSVSHRDKWINQRGHDHSWLRRLPNQHRQFFSALDIECVARFVESAGATMSPESATVICCPVDLRTRQTLAPSYHRRARRPVLSSQNGLSPVVLVADVFLEVHPRHLNSRVQHKKKKVARNSSYRQPFSRIAFINQLQKHLKMLERELLRKDTPPSAPTSSASSRSRLAQPPPTSPCCGTGAVH